MYQVIYLRKKKKGYSQQTATLNSVEDAFFWESVIKAQGAKDIQIRPI
jgi:hypothetical protein